MENNTHSVRNYIKPFPFLFIQRESNVQVSNVSTVTLCIFCLFSLKRGKKTFVLAARLQFQEVVLIPPVLGRDTIINLEGIFCRGEGLLGWKTIPPVLCEWAVSLGQRLSLRRCWKRKWNFLHRQQKLPWSRAFLVSRAPPSPKLVLLSSWGFSVVTWPSTRGHPFCRITHHQCYLLYCFSRVPMMAQKSVVRNLILRLWALVFTPGADTWGEGCAALRSTSFIFHALPPFGGVSPTSYT